MNRIQDKQNYDLRIFAFIHSILPLITDLIKSALQASGCDVKIEGAGLNTVFNIKSGKKEMTFYLHNLLLEIATIDRDEEPLRFDDNLVDFDYFVKKTVRIIDSKLKILFNLLSEENFDIAIDKITEMAKDYQRIRIWKFDKLKG
jgi:hypothetical protein